MKTELSKPTVLALYNAQAPTKISADASSYGLGAVILQKSESQWKPIAYASRSLTETETRYAQIEKEALPITWACEKFASYVLGMKIFIETDHKPLIPLLSTKHLDSLPPRILRFRLRLARFDYDICHIPGKLLYTADTLSRKPSAVRDNDAVLQEDAERLVEICVVNLPASKERLQQYHKAQEEDKLCCSVKEYCKEGWPEKKDLAHTLVQFWKARGNLSIDSNCNRQSRFFVSWWKNLNQELEVAAKWCAIVLITSRTASHTKR